MGDAKENGQHSKRPDREQHHQTRPPLDGTMSNDDRRDRCAHARSTSQKPETPWSGMQNGSRIDGQQRDCSPQQHREHVERDRTEY